MTGRAAWRELLVAAAVLVLAWLALEAVATRDHRDRTDEPEWIAISILHWRQLVLGEPPAGAELDPAEQRSSDPWKQGVQHTVFGYMNPCLPKVVLGAVLHAAGHRRASPMVFEIFHRERPEDGVSARAEMEPALPLARGVVQVLAALCALLVFLIGRELLAGWAGWLAGCLATSLFIASPVVRNTAAYVRTDFFMLPFVLAALFFALRAREALSGARGARAMHLAGLALGLFCGLAVSSKLNGALICLCVAIWVPLAWWRARGQTRPDALRGPFATLLLAGLLSASIFYALNPRLWSDPFGGASDILGRWDRQMAVQQERGERMNVEVARDLGERVTLFTDRMLGRDDPWRALTRLPGGVVLLAGGFGVLVWQAAKRRAGTPADREASAAWTAVVFVSIFIAGTALWLPLDWERFFLPAAPCLALLQALCLASLARLAAERIRRRT